MRHCLITGANRGLGLAFTKWAADSGYGVFAAARNDIPELFKNRENSLKRIYTDLAQPANSVDVISSEIADVPLDFIIHNAGLVDDSDFESLSNLEAEAVMNINLLTPLLLTRSLLPNLRQGKNKKVIFIGSVSGQNNSQCPSAFYAASRMGIIGAAQSLRQSFKADGLSFPVIEPGLMATDVDYDDGPQAAISKHGGDRMPVHDIIKTAEYILSLSEAACPKQIVTSSMTFGPV